METKDTTTHVTFGFREGLRFGLGLALPLFGLFLACLYVLLHVP